MTREEFKTLKPGDIVAITTNYEVETWKDGTKLALGGQGFGTVDDLIVDADEPLVIAMKVVERFADKQKRERYEQYLQLRKEFGDTK